MESVALLGRKCIVSRVNTALRAHGGLRKQEMTQEGVAQKKRTKATLARPTLNSCMAMLKAYKTHYL